MKTKIFFRTDRPNGESAEQVVFTRPEDELPTTIMSILKHVATTREDITIEEGLLMAMAAHEMGEPVRLIMVMEQVEE